MTAWLRGLFPVRPEERGVVLTLYALLVVTVVANWIGKVGSNSIFIKKVGVTALPYAYVLAPIVLLIASTLIFSLVGRVRRRELFIWYVGVVAVLSIATQGAMDLGAVDYWWAYVFAQVVKDTVYLIFWVYAGNLFDSEQSKRIFPLFAGALLIGKIAGGLLSTSLAPLIHSENFMAAQAAGFTVAFVVILLYRRRLPEGEGAITNDKVRPQGLGDRLRGSVAGYRAVASDGLLRPFGLSIFFWYFLMQIGNYLFTYSLDSATAGADTVQGAEDAYTLLYASVFTIGSVIALGIQTFMTGSLVRRLGVSLLLFVFPLWYVGWYGAGAVVGLTGIVGVLLQAGERIIVPAIHLPATQVVYNQISSSLRPRARAFFSGGVNAFAEIGAALVLVAGAIATDPRTVLIFGTACSVVFTGNTFVLRRALGRRIVENLASEDPELRRNAAQMLGGEGRAVPTEGLQSLLGEGSADVEARIQAALLRRGALRVAKGRAD